MRKKYRLRTQTGELVVLAPIDQDSYIYEWDSRSDAEFALEFLRSIRPREAEERAVRITYEDASVMQN